MVIETWSPKETYALGEKIGREALPGQVYTLNGDLGVGKTVFTQGVAAGLGNIQKLKDGEALSSRTNAEDDFEAVEDEDFLG